MKNFLIHHRVKEGCVMKNLKYGALLALVSIAFTASVRAEFLYVSYGGGLLSFSINGTSGALTKLPATPTLFTGGIGPITLDHTGKFLYASTGSSIHGYRIAWNGQLIPLPGSPYNVTGGLLAVDPFNRFLYATGSKIAVYRIEPNGSLRAVPGSPFATGGQIATDPFGRFIYVIDLRRSVSVYNVLANGALTPVPGSPFTALVTNYVATYPADDLIKVVADPTGRFVYTASEYSFNLMSFRVSLA
jgi:6-phosphogluconolactonase